MTIDSVPDPFQRERDITTFSVPALGFVYAGPFDLLGWRQGDLTLHAVPETADIQFAWIRYL